MRYYLSNDSNISTHDTPISTDYVKSLSAGSSSSEDYTAIIDSTGSYYIGACVDLKTNESNKNDNCSTGIRVSDPYTPSNNQ